MKQATRRENSWEMKNRSDNDQGQVDRLTHEEIDTHTCTCTTNKSNNHNSENNTQPHIGPHTFTRSLSTTAWRAESSSPSPSSSSSSSLLCTQSLLCRDVLDRQMVLRASENGVLFDCPKIRFAISVTPPHRQTTELTRNTTNDTNKASKLCMMIRVELMVATMTKPNTTMTTTSAALVMVRR